MADEQQQRRILVTGIADRIAAELVRELEEDDSVELIAGVDFREPRRAFKRAEVMVADLRSRALCHILEAVRPDTVVHLQRASYGEGEADIEEAHEISVMGTINLAASLQRTESMRKFVLMSSLHVYGGDPTDPAILTEDAKVRMPPRTKLAADLAEIEGAVNLLARGKRKLAVTCLRFADFIGRQSDEPLARYLRMPLVPSLWGYDPRLQFCHEEDAIAILKRAALEDCAGLYNVAADGAVYLSQALRLGARIQVPISPPLINPVMGVAKFAGLTTLGPHCLLTLRYGRVVANNRVKARFGQFRHTTREAVLDLYGIGAERAAMVKETVREERKVAAA
jgi:UDP-glucose 4-epimerase